MKIGYAQGLITPALTPPAFLAGFGRNRIAQSVHDDLTARVLCFDPGGSPTFLAVLDLLGLSRAHCLDVRAHIRRHLPDAELVLCCTHTHHGPDPIGFWGPDETTSGVHPPYIEQVKDTVVQTCLRAHTGARPAPSQRAASVRVPGLSKNYRDPEILDIDLTCLQFLDPVGRPVANLFIYPCHPEVLAPDNTAITSDFPHTLRTRTETETGAPSLFFAGALGGMMSPATPDRTHRGAAETGEILAEAALNALAGAAPEAIGSFHHRTRTFELELENPVFQLAIAAGLMPDVRTAEGKLITETRLLRFGDCWLVTVPGELFPALGLEIKSRVRSAGARIAGVIGLANDELGYIMPAEEFIFPENPFEPGDHYEETMSVSATIGPALMQAVQELLDENHRR